MTDLTPPPTLRPEEREIWNTYLQEIMRLGLQAQTPPARLLDLVSVTYQHQRATLLLSQTDILVNRDGNPVRNPAVDIQKQAADRIHALRRELHLNRQTGQTAAVDAPQAMIARGTWCATHQRFECGADRTYNRGTCHAIAILGVGRCHKHQGRNAGIKHELALMRLRNPLGAEPMDIGPAEAMLWRVGKLAAEVRELDARIAQLEDEELVWGTISVTDDADADGEAHSKTVRGARLSMWVQLRAQREEQLTRVCEACHRAGVEQKLVDLFKEQAQLIRLVLTTTLAKLGIAEDERLPVVMGEVIREVTGIRELGA